MKDLINISCKKATYLLSKKEEYALSFFEKIKLQIHLSVCGFCRLFEQQSKMICTNSNHAHHHYSGTLSDSSKEKMIRILKERID